MGGCEPWDIQGAWKRRGWRREEREKEKEITGIIVVGPRGRYCYERIASVRHVSGWRRARLGPGKHTDERATPSHPEEPQPVLALALMVLLAEG